MFSSSATTLLTSNVAARLIRLSLSMPWPNVPLDRVTEATQSQFVWTKIAHAAY